MTRRISRRTVAKLLLSGSAALALPKFLEGVPAKPPTRPALSASERKQFEKSVAQLRTSAKKIRELKIPMGSEPAFVFRPLLPAK